MKQYSDILKEELPQEPSLDEKNLWRQSPITQWFLADLRLNYQVILEDLPVSKASAELDLANFNFDRGQLQSLYNVITFLEDRGKNDE